MSIHELEVGRHLIMQGMNGWDVQMLSRQAFVLIVCCYFSMGPGFGNGWIGLASVALVGYLLLGKALGQGWESVVDDTPVFGLKIGT